MNAFKKFIFLSLLSGLFSCGSMASYEQSPFGEQVRVYAGADVQQRTMKFEENFGGNLFENRFGQVNIYAGARLFDYFGFQVGFEKTGDKDRTNILNEGEFYLGTLILPGDGIETHVTQTQLQGYYADLVGFLPICPRYNVDLFLTLGLVRHKLQLTDILTEIDGFPVFGDTIRTYENKKTLARVTAGIQSQPFPYLGVRIVGGWENTSRFNHLKSIEAPNAATDVNVKDSYFIGLGLFLTT